MSNIIINQHENFVKLGYTNHNHQTLAELKNNRKKIASEEITTMDPFKYSEFPSRSFFRVKYHIGLIKKPHKTFILK